MGGERYTFMSIVDAKLSKLDRFLACSNFLVSFPSSSVTAHPEDLSDHCLITLKTGIGDFVAPPFKFYSSWLLLNGLD